MLPLESGLTLHPAGRNDVGQASQSQMVTMAPLGQGALRTRQIGCPKPGIEHFVTRF